MRDIVILLQRVRQQTLQLAARLFRENTTQAVADSNDLLYSLEPKLREWIQNFQEGQIDESELRSLIQDQTHLVEMRALKQAGLAQAAIDTFLQGLADIITNEAISGTDSPGPAAVPT